MCSQQYEELEALKAIYDTDFCVIEGEARAFSIRVASTHGRSLELHIFFPVDYPSNSFPVWELKASSWLHTPDVDCIASNLYRIARQVDGYLAVVLNCHYLIYPVQGEYWTVSCSPVGGVATGVLGHKVHLYGVCDGGDRWR
ncbi:hypothetical protein EMCRGX_G031693 [Ephydatia muelleri]